jgi:hypothetical protein
MHPNNLDILSIQLKEKGCYMIDRFLDKDGLLCIWPKKHSDKMLVLEHLIKKFDDSHTYTESEVNSILKMHHTFSDWPLLRRELVDRGYMQRDRNGYEYKVIKKDT